MDALLSRCAEIRTFVIPVIAGEGVNVRVPLDSGAAEVEVEPSKAPRICTLALYAVPVVSSTQLSKY